MAKTKRLILGKRLAQARTSFDGRRRKCKLSFDQIRERLERGDTFKSIASAAGIARSRVRIIYELWFRKLLHLPKGHVRRKERWNEKRKIAQEKLKRLPEKDVLRLVAQQEGYEFIKPVPRDQRTRLGQARVRELYVHGRLCGVHHLRNIRRQKGRHASYASTTLCRSSVEEQDCKTFYIEVGGRMKRIDMEREDLLALFKRPGQKKVTLYLTVK